MVVDLYHHLYELLSTDSQVLALLGIAPDDKDSLTRQIIKRRKLAELSDVAKPLLSFYATSGKRDTDNPLLLTSFFRLEVITPGDVELAHQIASRLFHLLDDQSLSMSGIEGLDTYVVSQQESDTGHSSAYCFTLITKFTLQVC
ncbi:hypothetical protein [Brevibacillus sp. DP1.3A]|uniref:hypothetical protein n=1 Tax=Brevibacillus sp. DP1.3A TaxID=2738867 RepID=UPI00156B8C22|nr:hypothetical protein [Brevibacillus sp. DP1.3A]UED74462.1 hypothetical protein HP399_027715 [Brevibacillus sp. DP1.3A]